VQFDGALHSAISCSSFWGEDLLCKRALGWWGLEAIGSVDHALVVVVEGLSVFCSGPWASPSVCRRALTAMPSLILNV
jgi:hypothetical protein